MASPATSYKVGILGTGDVGQAIGHALIAQGHHVLLSGREATNEKAVAWAKANGERASSGTFADAAKFGDIVVISVNGKWPAIEAALAAAGPAQLEGKIVIDTVNPLEFGADGPSIAPSPDNVSVTEWLQARLPKSKVVKALNTVNYRNFYQPRFVGGADAHIAGNDSEAKAVVRGILRSFGWEKDGHRVLDFGVPPGPAEVTSMVQLARAGAKSGRDLEYCALLFIKFALATNDWTHGIRFVTAKNPLPSPQ